jgi:tRNA(Ile)-lysidine synthase
LLHLAASSSEIKSKISAVYVNHGLQIEADQWENHCAAIALALNVDFQCLKVNAQKGSRQSPEEVARDMRYGALKTLLSKNEVLLVAQHREDQMETMLLQLFRGAGLAGLSGMPLSIAFGAGELCRPFLDSSKQVIKDYAVQHNLHWIEDPSNKDDRYDRNFLRNQILPLLKQRWPAIDKTVARSARHCANDHSLLQELASKLLDNISDKTDQTLNISQLLKLDSNKQHLVIRQWFSSRQLRMPSEKMLGKILNEVAVAKVCGMPEVRGKDYCIRRYRDKLFCLKGSFQAVELAEKKWQKGIEVIKLDDGQQVEIVEASDGISKLIWCNSDVSIRFRTGSEKIKLSGRNGRHSLKKLFQEKGIPHWERNSIPLVYINEKLAAVADLWISADFYTIEKGECYQFNWVKKVEG